jgi:polysaccharide deacetylase family protein (PEP-CTERM system associated)
MMNNVCNILTVDVEDYFMVSAFSNIVKTDTWDHYSSRVERNTMRVLDILDKSGAKGTFFILGWIAERYPQIVKEIDRRGHEIGCHSYLHKLVYEMSSEDFKEDTVKAKDILENIIGKKIFGYRAPSYSITKKSFWALEVIREAGFIYDSSIFPIIHDRYGYPEFSRFPTVVDTASGGILEIPLSTLRVLDKNIPVGGGGYLRLFPMVCTEWAIRRINEKEKEAAIVYFHPWEIDPKQPRLNGSDLSKFRHYTNIKKMERRIESLVGNFKFGPVNDVFNGHISDLMRCNGQRTHRETKGMRG